jgi:hypothetical protein
MREDIERVLNMEGQTELRCPFTGCDLPDMTHVVRVTWETDPYEGDRKRVRLEVRCESGHGFFLDIKNHAGLSYFQWEALSDIQSPFSEERTW